jgi:hypothetical protein
LAAPSFQLGKGSAALLDPAKNRNNIAVTATHSARRLIVADPDAPPRLARQSTLIAQPASAAVVRALIEVHLPALIRTRLCWILRVQ